jgi:metal-responsive CopG/Arc/MetJ family transcriptional regulator
MVRINTIFREDILEEIDLIAKEKGKSRSALLREAAEKMIKEYQQMKTEETRQRKIKQAINVQDRLRKKSGQWDAVTELRKWRETRP